MDPIAAELYHLALLHDKSLRVDNTIFYFPPSLYGILYALELLADQTYI